MEIEKNIEKAMPSTEGQDREHVDSIKTTKIPSTAKQLRLALSIPPEHDLNWLQAELKRRGIQKVDLSEIIMEALTQVPKKWWEQKAEDLTPLEFKVQQALENPDLREKFTAFLASMEN